MISFDYVRSARPDWLRSLLQVRIPARLHAALAATLASVAVTGGAFGIEMYRLSDARRVEAAYRVRFEMSQRAMQRTNVYYEQIMKLAALDARVRTIVISGDEDARTLAEVANHLPERAWLTQISRDSDGLVLEGKAENLTTVAAVLHGLMRARDLRNPILTSAQTVSDRTEKPLVKYVIHVDGVR